MSNNVVYAFTSKHAYFNAWEFLVRTGCSFEFNSEIFELTIDHDNDCYVNDPSILEQINCYMLG